MSRAERSIAAATQRSERITIEIAPAMRGGRRLYHKNGQQWDVFFGGAHLLRARDPVHAAARALKARGLRGILHVYHRGSPHCASRIDIDKAASRMTSETTTEGPIFRPYRDWSERKSNVACRKQS